MAWSCPKTLFSPEEVWPKVPMLAFLEFPSLSLSLSLALYTLRPVKRRFIFNLPSEES